MPMLKYPHLLAAASLAGLSSCIPPETDIHSPYGRPYGAQNPYGSSLPPEPTGPTTAPLGPEGITRPAPPQSTPTGGYPTAQPTTNPDEVLSPYEPYNVIDISGPPRFKSGQLARDPSNQKIFRVP